MGHIGSIGLHKGHVGHIWVHPSFLILGNHRLPLATIHLVDDKGYLMFEAYFEVLYPYLIDDSFRTLTVHHCFLLDDHWLPLTTIQFVCDNKKSTF